MLISSGLRFGLERDYGGFQLSLNTVCKNTVGETTIVCPHLDEKKDYFIRLDTYQLCPEWE